MRKSTRVSFFEAGTCGRRVEAMVAREGNGALTAMSSEYCGDAVVGVHVSDSRFVAQLQQYMFILFRDATAHMIRSHAISTRVWRNRAELSSYGYGRVQKQTYTQNLLPHTAAYGRLHRM
jgi:hypothetical protein